MPGGGPSLRTLCSVSKRACDALAPLVRAFYETLNSRTSKTKLDDSAFTIADGAVQHLLSRHLFGHSKFGGIVGEEDCNVNLSETPYSVDDLIVPDEFVPLVDRTAQMIQTLSDDILPCDLYESLTVFVDPIDGTKEFSSGKGEQCSICIGFADERGRAVAGVVYRPLTDPPTYAAGARGEGYFESHLDVADPPATSGLLTSNGRISPFLVSLMEELEWERVPSGGAGNKMLLLLERKGSAYVQDRGVSRWDTCAAQACLEASGGVLIKLTSFLKGEEDEGSSYTYLSSETNLDFEEGVSRLTLYNCRPEVGMKKGDSSRIISDVSEVKPYSNLCGLFALGPEGNMVEHRRVLLAAAKAASAKNEPSYD